MAVMVFIHGESYDTGTGNAYDGSVLSSFGQVIVVTINYRLGVLGFLSTEDHEAMGNFALLDVAQALLWLRDNIATFDGDPNRVTLFGHGRGAAIVNLLMLSPFVSEGSGKFFQRAIIQSGSAYSTWAVSYDPKWCRERLAISVNCSQHLSNSKALINCLRKRSYTELINAAPKAPKYYCCFAPSIDQWTVLPADVDKLVQERNSKFASVPVMFGITKNEAYAYLKQSEVRKGISEARKMQIIRTYVQNVFRYHRQKIYEILDHHYTDWTDPTDPISNRNSILELLSDGQYVSPLIRMANDHAETADTYLYSFAYSTQSETKEKVQGIHGDELPYVFGAPLVDGISPFPSSYTSTEKMMSHAIMTYWTNFAKSGDPNSPVNQSSTVALNTEKVNNRFYNLHWPKYTKDTQEYLPISRRPTTRHHYRAQKLALWQELIPKINRDDGSDPQSHLLDQWDNMSTFDDYDNLVRNFENIFPSPPPMPPSRPVPINNGGGTSMNRNNPWVTVDYEMESRGTGNPQDSNASDGTKGEGSENPLDASGKGNENGVTSEVMNSATSGDSTTGVPLSMVVAIGGSLLLINILIFAGLCYQRERIRKMRLGKMDDTPDLTFEDTRLHRKCEHDSTHNSVCGAAGGAAPECLSLMSASSSHQHCQSPRKNSNGLTHIHNPSPQPSNNSRRGPSQSRSTPPTEPVNCNYTPLPTNITSPVHRPSSRGVGSGGGVQTTPMNHAGTIDSKNRHLGEGHQTPRPMVPSGEIAINANGGDRVVGGGGSSAFVAPGGHGRHLDAPPTIAGSSMPPVSGPGIGLSTFGPGYQGGGRPRDGGSGGPGSGSAVDATKSLDSTIVKGDGSGDSEAVYKTINKSGQNNAVTIV